MAKRNEKGVSLIELLAGMAIFSILVVVLTGIFVGSIRNQVNVLESQKLIGEIRYVLENVSRVGMLARTDTGGTCLSESEKSYEFIGDEFSFIDDRERCNVYSVDDGVIYRKLIEDRGSGAEIERRLTSPEVSVERFDVEIIDGGEQEKVMLLIEMKTEGVSAHAQTTFSKRTLR